MATERTQARGDAKADEPPDDIFEGPGFKVERRGRQIELRTHRSPEEHRELMRRMIESRPKILAEIQSRTTELTEIIHKYSSLDLVANLLLREGMQNPNTYKETDSKLRPHWVEHAAVLELKDARYELRMPLLVSPKDVERAHTLLEEIFTQTVWYYMAEHADPKTYGPPSRIDELRFFTLLHGMSVRSPAYASHWRDVLHGLFDHGSALERLSSSNNIDLRSALAIIDAFEEHITESLMGRFEQAREAREDILSHLKDYIATGKFKGEANKKELFDRIRNMRGKERKQYLNSVLTEWTRVALGTVLSITEDRIAELSGISRDRVRAFLAEASVEFGATPSDYLLPAPVNIRHERPIIHHDDDYFCPTPHLLPWAVKPMFERLLSSTPMWNAYQKQRSSYLIKTALQYFASMLPGSIGYESLFYPTEAGGRAELDGLVLFDRYAFMIEAKAGSLGAARRGGKLKIKSQLEALVGEAADQVVRAHDYVRGADIPVFTLKDGTTVELDKSKHPEHALITVTLDVLDIFTADMYQMREIGVITAHDLPWAVALTDLRCISEILLRSVEFTHFLRWRMARIGDPSLSGGRDELNWLAIYLKEGPKPPSAPEGYDFQSFTSYTDDFDAYFLYKEGARTIPAPRPAQPLPDPLGQLLDALITTQQQGFTEPCEQLLDLCFDDRSRLAQHLVEFAFNESKGRRAEFAFETESATVKVTDRVPSGGDVRAQAEALRKATGKPAIVLTASAQPNWTVYGWATASAPTEERSA
jgi:hypothetical protein